MKEPLRQYGEWAAAEFSIASSEKFRNLMA
jgi:hypothetical protein